MRLSQKWHAVGCSVMVSEHTDSTPPVERRHPPHRVIVVELGKPVFLPSGWAGRVCELQSVQWDSGQRIAEKANAGRNGPDRRLRAPPERGADFRVVWNGESVCRIPSTGGKQV